MDGISWTDLDADEQRVLTKLYDGIPAQFCDPVAVLSLNRIGFIKGSRLTMEAEKLLSTALLLEIA